jgi:hypothetical protein
VLDSELGALAHRLVGGLRSCSYDDRLGAVGDRSEVVIGAIAFDLVGVRVDGEDVVASLAQALVDDVAAVASRRSGDAGDGDSLVAEEVGCGLLDRCHRQLLLSG